MQSFEKPHKSLKNILGNKILINEKVLIKLGDFYFFQVS